MFVTSKALNLSIRPAIRRDVRQSFVPRVLKISFLARSRSAVT
jgi:hypothetical protein